MFGFLILWVLLSIIGTFIRGPGWMWFWPGETWDHHRVVHEVNTHLHEVVGLTDPLMIGIFGGRRDARRARGDGRRRRHHDPQEAPDALPTPETSSSTSTPSVWSS